MTCLPDVHKDRYSCAEHLHPFWKLHNHIIFGRIYSVSVGNLTRHDIKQYVFKVIPTVCMGTNYGRTEVRVETDFSLLMNHCSRKSCVAVVLFFVTYILGKRLYERNEHITPVLAALH